MLCFITTRCGGGSGGLAISISVSSEIWKIFSDVFYNCCAPAAPSTSFVCDCVYWGKQQLSECTSAIHKHKVYYLCVCHKPMDIVSTTQNRKYMHKQDLISFESYLNILIWYWIHKLYVECLPSVCIFSLWRDFFLRYVPLMVSNFLPRYLTEAQPQPDLLSGFMILLQWIAQADGEQKMVSVSCDLIFPSGCRSPTNFCPCTRNVGIEKDKI